MKCLHKGWCEVYFLFHSLYLCVTWGRDDKLGDFHLQPLSWKITIEGLRVEKGLLILHFWEVAANPISDNGIRVLPQNLLRSGSDFRRNVDNSTTVSENPSLIFPSYWSMPMDFRAREISSSCFLAVEAVDWCHWHLSRKNVLVYSRSLWALQSSAHKLLL